MIRRMNDLKYWVAFHQVSGLGPVTFAKLEARFGDIPIQKLLEPEILAQIFGR